MKTLIGVFSILALAITFLAWVYSVLSKWSLDSGDYLLIIWVLMFIIVWAAPGKNVKHSQVPPSVPGPD